MSTPREGSLEYWAQQRPDSAAIIENSEVLTFGSWNHLADALAEGLTKRGIVAGDIIVTRLQIRKEWPIIAAAAAKLGCAILGLNWRLTPAETHYVLSDSKANVVICDDPDPVALMPAFAGLPLKLIVSVDAQAAGFTALSDLFDPAAPTRFSPSDERLIIYTSGTTGLPKGVPLSDARNMDSQQLKELMEYSRSVGESRPQVPGDVALLTIPLHHGAGPGVVRQSLKNGNLVVFLRRFDPEAALELIQRHRISFWTAVPTIYKRIAGLPPETLARFDVSSIRSLSVGAAPVSPDLKSWIAGYFGNCLYETYGATEVGMITSLSPEMQRLKPGSSGLPHAHVHIRIRDSEGRDLATGEAGEIWLKSPATIRSYLNAQMLGSDTIDAEGFFRIGDVGRLDEDGYLFITDRVKDMIISGGVNIYPAEIEAVLLKHPAVQDAAVIGIPHDEFGEQVKAFVELKPGHTAGPEEIMASCAEHLASYKRPRSLDVMPELPRNTMGKLLKRELREPYWAERERKV
jgi:long-chain acyl-CoA synthetase